MTDAESIPLVREFEEVVGLESVDAYRSAFTALAVAKGWTKARVGRYLGISRARVGQKVEKLEHYAFVYGDRTPELQAAVKQFSVVRPKPKGKKVKPRGVAAFEVQDWNDLVFARHLIDQVS